MRGVGDPVRAGRGWVLPLAWRVAEQGRRGERARAKRKRKETFGVGWGGLVAFGCVRLCGSAAFV